MADVERSRIALTGLEAPVEIIVDEWGVPHIYARSLADLFFAQGWNAARERLWQLDLWRKRGLGLLSESFGPAYIDQDRANRLFLYRGDMDAEWAAYGPDAKTWSTAFVAGLNARVAEVLAGAAPLPVEFGLTDSAPAHWALDDLVRIRSHGISNNAESESLRARVAAAAGDVAADRIRRYVHPPHVATLPEGLGLADIPDDLYAVYTLATKEVAFEPAPPPAPAAHHESNNWAIAGSRTATGRPILANDPHRVLLAPSIRYMAHLEAPGFSVIGAGEPHLPGVTIGHNGAAAFGITIFMADTADFYVYETAPGDPRRYRYGDGWEAMRTLRETIPVRGAAPVEVELAYTRHGPVVSEDRARGRAVALRSTWWEPGTHSYFGAARYQQAKDWPTFRAALAHWGGAAMNFVYADVGGTIAWQPAGKMPRRPNWDGLTPVPGDGRYEWDGFLSQDELPTIENPARGFVATANEMNLPATHPIERMNIGYEWSDPGRARRIEEVLGATPRATLADSMALQLDAFCHTALRGIALANTLAPSEPRMAAALQRLRDWDGVESIESPAAAIAEVWLNKHLAPATARRITNARAASIIAHGLPLPVIAWLESLDAALGPDPRAARAEILEESLSAALDEIAGLLGPDMDAWRWGDLHRIHFVPPAAVLAAPDLRARMSQGPAPLPGSGFTPAAATYRMTDFAVTNGASFRMVLDVGDWDQSRVINTPGQSGEVDSPHYGDLFDRWVAGQYVPLLYTRAAIEEAAEQVIILEPI